MLFTTGWFNTCIHFVCICGWALGSRPQFDTSTNMGLVLVPADAEVDSVIFRLRATDQDADFPLIFDITAAVQPIVRVENLPCTLYNKVCQANVILTRRLVPERLHDFAVRVRDSKGDSNSMQATISVTNATTPRDMIFPHVPSIIMVPEDTKPGKELDYLLVRANPWHGKPVYIELWQPKELFTIRQRQTPTQTRGVIILEGELDFETQSMYTLTMYATDPYTEAGKDTRNIAGVHVVVIVQDVQDVPPVFTIAPPLTRVNNSVKPGDVILRVHAEDGDKGTPREVTYGLVSEGNPLTPFFNISESTGEITLARPLDELTQITHVGAPILLTVVAEEVRRSREEPPGQATVVELGLLLGEPGNSPPYFESDSYMAWMDENAVPGTVVMFDKPYLTRVRDEDIGKTGVFALKLGNNNGTFEVTPSVAERVANFVVTVRDNTLMDYETRKTLQFTIIAQEIGPATNLSTSVPVIIFLRDVNDNPPEFDKDSYEVTLAENVSPGTRVIQVHASDKDTGSSGSVKYTNIIGPGSEILTMDSDTGLILVAKGSKGLDRELTPSLQLLIEATDEDGKGLKSTVPLIVNILDVNDNAPIFEKSVYEFVLNSDRTNFTSPAFIKAIDADAEPPNNEVRYELMHGNYGDKFYLNEITGELILKEPLEKSRKRRNNAFVNFSEKFRSDFLQTLNSFKKISASTEKPLRIWKNRKKRNSENILYTLIVRAYDLGVPHRSSTAKVHIATATPTGALTLMLVVPAEHLDPVRTTETLAAITGGRVTIQDIRPYVDPSGSNDGKLPARKMSLVVARVEPTMSGTFLVDVETIQKTLAANDMKIVPVVDNSDTNTVDEVTSVSVTNSGSGIVESVPVKTETTNVANPVIAPTVGGVIPTTTEGKTGGTNGAAGNDDGGPVFGPGGTEKGSSGGGESITIGGTAGGTQGNNNAGNTGGETGSGSVGGSNGVSTETKGESNPGKGTTGNENEGIAGNTGGVVLGTKDQTQTGGVVKVEENIVKVNKTTSNTENSYTVYKAENKLLLWLLILLGLLMLLALLALILCCICPGCPFYMAPRKRRVHSFESIHHPDGRPKRHLRRKQINPVRAEWSGKKQAWSADPLRRNWQFNRRNTKNRGLASLPGDVALAETLQGQSKPPSIRLRDNLEPWAIQYPIHQRKDDRLYVEDVEAGRTYDTEDIDSLRRHEMERGSEVLRHSYRQTDETSRYPREQHFYRDGNAEVLRLVTGGNNNIGGDDISLQVQRPTTLVSEQQALGYRSDGKEILLRRFIEDQKIRQHHDLHGSVQEIPAEVLDPRRQTGEQFLQTHEVIILPRNLELDHRHHREERDGSVQRLIIDHGDIENEEELRTQENRQQESDLRQQRKVAAAMLVGTAVSKAIEKPTLNIEQHPSSVNIPTYAIHDVELAKQNALLTQLLMDRADARHLGVPGLDPGSYLETQSLPGQVAIATQTDRTTSTQTENYSQVRSRSDNEESEEDIRSRRKSKSKKRFGNEIRRSRSLKMRSPIQEESRSFSETRNSLLRRKAKEARDGRRATLEPEVLQEISDSLDEQASTPSPENLKDERKNVEYQSEEPEDEDERKDISKDKYHRRSHAKSAISEAGKAETSNKKQQSPIKSKTRLQKSDSKSAESKKTNSGKKDSDSTSTDAKSNSKKKSADSHSNVSGTEGKKEIEDIRKTLVKSVSKSGMLKSSSEKPVKKNKIEEILVTRKRAVLKHQKAKKVSTESSEFEEIPVKPKLSNSLKPKPSKRSNLKLGELAKAKESNTLSDESKSRSSGTDRDRDPIPEQQQKQSDSTSSTGTTEQEITKNEKAEVAEDSKTNQSRGSGEIPKSVDEETGKELVSDRQITAKEISDKREELPAELKSEILKSSTAALIVSQLMPMIKDELKMSEENSEKDEKTSPKADSELPKPSETSLPEKKTPEPEEEKVLKIDETTPDKLEEITALESIKNLEVKTETVLKEGEKKLNNLEADITKLETGISEIDKDLTSLREKEILDISAEKILKSPEEVITDVSTLSSNILSLEKQSEPSKSEVISTSEKIQDKAEEISPKSDHEVVETTTKIVSEIKEPELNPKDITEEFLQSEAQQSAHDAQKPLTETMKIEEIPKNDESESLKHVSEKKADVKISETEILNAPSVSRSQDKESPLKKSPKNSNDSFTIISKPEKSHDAILQVVLQPNEENASPEMESTRELKNDEKRDEERKKLRKDTSKESLERSQQSDEELPSVLERNKSMNESENEENTEKGSPQKKSNDDSGDENFPTTGSPSFYILSSTSSQEGFIPDRQVTHAQISPDNTLSENAATLVKAFSNFPSEQRPDDKLSKSKSEDWDPQRIELGDVSSGSPDNSQPYQTPRHRSRNRTGTSEISSQLLEEKKEMSEIEARELTPRLIAEEAIRSGLEEIMKSDLMEKEKQRRETTSRVKPSHESSRIPLAKSNLDKNGNGSKSSKKMEDLEEVVKPLARPKTEPKPKNPREGDTQVMVRPRTQRGKAEAAPVLRGPKAMEKKSRQVTKQNVDEIKSENLSEVKENEVGVTPKEGYMSRYKQKREEMERKRKELKEAAEEEQRPRWQRKPLLIQPQRVAAKEFVSESKTPEGAATPRTKRRIKPLVNAESEQLRAMVKEGRKQRKAEGGDSDDPTVEIFANEPPAPAPAPAPPPPNITTSFKSSSSSSTSYKYDKIPAPFYLHPPPPPPPHSSPQISPHHNVGPLDVRRTDDDLDSGIAVSLQGGNKLRHQQLLDKKSVFDIAYNEAAPSQLRTDSTTPPS